MNLASQFLSTTGWEYKEVSSQQYNIKVCPLCFDERWKFYISYEGLWDCKICGEVGNLYQLKAKLGGIDEISSLNKLFENKKELDISLLEEYEENLKTNKEAYLYLIKKRKFTPEIIKKFRLGSDGQWIAIPHFQDGKLWNFKMRNYVDKEFRRVQGQPSILFNIDRLNLKKKSLVIVESETDCIATTQLGVHNVVGLSTGAGTFSPEWISSTLKYKEIYICLNSDLAGQKGAYKIADKLGVAKCRNVILPTKDVNDYLIEGHTKEEFIELLKTSKKFNIDNISNIADYVKDLDDWFDKEGNLKGLTIPFITIQQCLNGFKEEDLIVLAGDAGVGKTTISLNMLHEFISNQTRCLCFFLEGKIKYYILRMMCMEQRVKYEDLKDNLEWENIKKRFASYPLYFYSGAQTDLDTRKLTDLLKIAVKMYDIEFVIVDNLQKFIKDDRDVVSLTSQAVSVLKDLAVDLKIPILLISHIRKTPSDRKRITMHDAKSSSSIYQVADIYLTLWNNKNTRDKEDDMILTIDKNRMGEGGIDTNMVYEKEFGIYRESIPELEGKKKKVKKIQEKEDDLESDTPWISEGFDDEE